MPKLTFPAAGEAMPAAEEMHIITGRFSRRLILAGLASLPAIAGATAALPAPLALLITPPTLPTRESAHAKLGRLEALLDTLPPEIAAAYRAQLYGWIDHIAWMHESGAPRAEIHAYIRSMRYNDEVFDRFKAALSGTTL
ncbi:hypothetical protein FJW04_22015 [Mesorhizobium sp. B2-7-3]|uniref:hypothetical protein n=1 Tax=unclassified Mesorhizobium TaxID=325217 RepID=UPI00112EB6B8|nr:MULTISPECIES: hypothetical protein [unclassified Mesorhizobium]MBZ9927775.1 hypothetical protein [Mesorhizobium sp. BR1-1-4]TPJ12936.1 hypothetical protein FJW04_22015 [Mesorhizobium sp. B2-7-3]